MQFEASQDQLAKALALVSRVIQPQNNLAVLSGVQLDARDNVLSITGTDLFTMLVSHIPVHVDEPGTIVVPAALTAELIHKLPTATLTVQANYDSGKAIVRYGKNQATLHGFAQERLPDFPDIEGPLRTIAIAAGTFPRLARQLLFACAKDETRPILRGVSLKLGSGRLVLAATDGSRLSQTWIPVPEYLDDPLECVLPAKAVAEAARLNTAADGELTVGSNMMRFRSSEGELVARLLDGQYPDYQRVIPQEYVAQGRINVNDFRGALERANLIAAKDRAASVRIRHTVGELQISASAQEYGQTLESVECDSHGQDLDLLFNPIYLLEALRSLEGDEALLEFSGVQSPLRIREVEHSQYSHVVLPLRQLV
ncbi:DNA polymerase III, beta subunit [Sulfobacillus acidophilus TPY]|uniref:Beta sliding clamp n=1 Tax=Sulfobacillus acidophilus (strain ATCC 700253 / DSM 10332 / NAL) TaxID=679936 RepID=G8TUZ9_SULAD|nr:DNA polymerase III, beta subunit [Sulfobacillus acidophilus TPY]AEW03580.1 DNA polymerase III, beta subunit [Sulfobacillus acidophilus DSM 10332]MCY0864360.1 DNA polymerase III subunit beta [Sulfobacillus sp.]